MSEAMVKKVINAPAEMVWETLRNFDGIDRYLPAVRSCTVEGSGVGAKRTCLLMDGLRLYERLESLDENSRSLSYSITGSDKPTPFQDYIGVITVRHVGENQAEVEWSGTFKVKGSPEAEIVGMLEGMYTQAIEGLEKLHGQGMN